MFIQHFLRQQPILSRYHKFYYLNYKQKFISMQTVKRVQGQEQVVANCSRDLAQVLEKSSRKKDFIFNKDMAVKKQLLKVTDVYEIGKKLGSGSFGEVYLAYHKQLKLTRALKIIKKTEKVRPLDVEQQLKILKELDHPSVLKIYQYFETERQWQIITEYFDGKQLFEIIVTQKQKGLTQQKAAQIFAQICRALSYIHSHQIVHRDIKPENILVKKQPDNSYQVKLIDWGLGSKSVKELIRKCGTPEYCAPEVIKGSYGLQCDLWSLGVVLYVMLVGKFPFKGKNPAETLSIVLKGSLNFQTPQWRNISTQAKILVAKLLNKDPKARITAVMCLQSEWVESKTKTNSNQESQQKLIFTLERLKKVNFQNKFQAIVINLINNYFQCQEQEVQLRKQFLSLDQNKDGVISFQQMKKAYEKVYSPLEAQRITEQIFNQMDLNGSKQIQYSEFVAFGRKMQSEFSIQQLRQAFRQFDQDEDGTINRKQLNNFLSYQKNTQSQDFDELLREIDANNDGKIDVEQFILSIDSAIKRAIERQTQKEGVKKLQKSEFLCHELANNIIQQNRVLKRSSISTEHNSITHEEKQSKSIG